MTKLDTLKQQTADLEVKLEETTEKLEEMKAEIERLENVWKMKCPYDVGDEYFALNHRGSIIETSWDNHCIDEERLEFGNTFPTKQAAELEAKRRNLLTRFRAFRDECNGDWKSDWDINKEKYFLYFSVNYGIFCSGVNRYCYRFNLFGYFKNKADCERAIELFGDEIKELFVEGE